MNKHMQNFYISAPVKMLDVPIELAEFRKKNVEGDYLDPVEYMTIPEYLSQLTYKQEVTRFNNDNTMWVKGFYFTIDGLDRFRSKLESYGLVEGVSIFILTELEVVSFLKQEDWISKEV